MKFPKKYVKVIKESFWIRIKFLVKDKKPLNNIKQNDKEKTIK